MPTANSTSPVTTTTTGRINRRTAADKPLLSTSKSIQDHISGTGTKTDVTNLNTARKLLLTHGLVMPTAGNMLRSISVALFEFSITANLGATHTDILRAIALIIQEVDTEIDTENIIEKVKALIGGPIATLDEKVETLTETIDAQKKTLESITEVRTNLKTSAEDLEKIAGNMKSTTPQRTSNARSDGPRTFADAAKTNIPTPLTKVLARSEAQARQILVDRRSQLFTNSLKNLTEVQLVAKATLAVEQMTVEKIALPTSMNFISARRLPHGGVLYELNSTEAAEWFNVAANRGYFLEHFGAEIVIKERTHNVIVENVPVTFVSNNPAALADIEKKAGLKPRTISKTRYIKPEARRKPGQRTAHIIVTFNSKEGANQAIKFGLTIEGKKVYGRKLIPEPTRCLKCHSFENTHMAAECPQEQETCGTCGEHHRTAACQVTAQTEFFCRNCDMKGHAAWSRECPTFTKKWEGHKNRNEDAKYRFFLTEDPLTWETLTSQNFEENSETAPTKQQTMEEHQPQRYPPPRNRLGPGQTTNNNNHQERTERNHNNKNANRIPLGGQSRIPEAWQTTRLQADHRTQRKPPTQEEIETQSTPPRWSTSPYGFPNEPYNPQGGWDQDHAGN